MILRRKPTIFSAVVAALLLLFVSTCWGQQSTDAQSSRPNGAITGRVLNSAGEPMSGATVYAGTLFPATRSRSARVDNAGDFKIDGLEAGLYRVSAGMPGYIQANQQNPMDPTNVYRVGDSVTFTMIKGGVITGTVTGANGPMIAVGVYAIRVRDEEGKRLPTNALIRERSTDDRGVYRFYGLLPGTYQVLAARPRTGLIAPSAYDHDMPTYFPSSTRDTAAEITVRDGEETTADIQYRGEPGHAISGRVSGLVESQTQFSPGATIILTDVDGRAVSMGTPVNSWEKFSFDIYGVPDGEYEISALQFLPSRDELRSPPQRVTVRGSDVTGVTLTLASQASIKGRLVLESDPAAGCGKRRDTAVLETIVYARRYEPQKKNDGAGKVIPVAETLLSAKNYMSLAVVDEKGSFSLRNLPPGQYRIDPRAPASGWYVRSIAVGANQTAAAKQAAQIVARDGIAVKSGEGFSGLIVTITEGAASVRGRVTLPEGQRLPSNVRIYFVPAEKENATDVLRFFEARVEPDATFAIGNIVPGKYWVITRAETRETTEVKPMGQDSDLRAVILREAEKLKTELVLKPCERKTDYDLSYQPPDRNE
jgi:Carboxypeptidase regulatory-like domain